MVAEDNAVGYKTDGAEKRKINDRAVFSSGMVRVFAVVIRLPIVNPKAAGHIMPDSIVNKELIRWLLSEKSSSDLNIYKSIHTVNINIAAEAARAISGRIVFFFAGDGNGGGVVMAV